MGVIGLATSLSNYYISSGSGTSRHELVAFDNALLDAGLSNYNLLKVSSILPAGCTQQSEVSLAFGSPLLTAFSTVSSNVPGTRLATAVAVGIPRDKSQIGVIMECKGESAEELEVKAKDMVAEAMRNHGIEIQEILVSSTSGIVEENYLSLISAIALW